MVKQVQSRKGGDLAQYQNSIEKLSRVVPLYYLCGNQNHLLADAGIDAISADIEEMSFQIKYLSERAGVILEVLEAFRNDPNTDLGLLARKYMSAAGFDLDLIHYGSQLLLTRLQETTLRVMNAMGLRVDRYASLIEWIIEQPTVFDRPDPKNKDYSMEEWDLYANSTVSFSNAGEGLCINIGKNPRIPNHGLSIRKNLISGAFELFRRFYDLNITGNNIFPDPEGKYCREVIFTSNFFATVAKGEEEYYRLHPEDSPKSAIQATS